MNNHFFDKQVKQKAVQHEAAVPPGMWDSIAKKKKRRYAIFWWFIPIVFVMGIGCWAIYETSMKKDSKLSLVTRGKSTKTEADDRSASSINNDSNTSLIIQEEKSAIKLYKTDPSVINETKAETNWRITTNGVVKRKAKKERLEAVVDMNNKKSGLYEKNSDTKNFNEAIVIDVNNADDAVLAPGKTSKEQNLMVEPVPVSAEKVAAEKKELEILPVPSTMEPDSPTHPITAIKASKKTGLILELSVMPFVPLQKSESILYIDRSNTGAWQQAKYRADEINTTLKTAVAYTIGLSKRIRKFEIGIGLQYSMIKEKVKLSGTEINTNYAEVLRMVNGSSGPVLVKDTVETTSSGTRTIDALNSYRSFSLPLTVQYTILRSPAWSVKLNGGLVFNLSSSYHNSIEGNLIRVNSAGVVTEKQSTTTGLDIITGLRVARKLGNYEIFAAPVFRYNMKGYDLQGMIQKKFIHKAGISLGIALPL